MDECTSFLQWALPRLDMRWKGFKKVRNQVCKRIRRRLETLDLESYGAYRTFLEEHPEEWEVLDGLCIVTISRFYRDWAVFDALREWLPKAGREARETGRNLRCWSAGCASGEEPYTLSLIFHFDLHPAFPDLNWEIIATDIDAHMLQRARNACYTESSFENLPRPWVEEAFEKSAEMYCLKERFKEKVRLQQQDVREENPEGPFDLILCRYLVGFYYKKELQVEIYSRLGELLRPDGLLVLGNQEEIPKEVTGLELWDKGKHLYKKRAKKQRRSRERN